MQLQEGDKFVRLAEAYVKGNNVCLNKPHPFVPGDGRSAGRQAGNVLTVTRARAIFFYRSNTYAYPTRSSTWSRSSRTTNRAASGADAADMGNRGAAATTTAGGEVGTGADGAGARGGEEVGGGVPEGRGRMFGGAVKWLWSVPRTYRAAPFLCDTHTNTRARTHTQ